MTSLTPEEALAEARRRIDRLDSRLVELAAQRLAAASDAGRAKARIGQSLVDFAREREVMENVRRAAQEAGMDPVVAQDLVTRLILASTARQEEERKAAKPVAEAKQAVVVGGAGRMGGWLVRFLQNQDYNVLVLDPATSRGSVDAAAAVPTADLILLSIPPSEAAAFLKRLAEAPPAGIVADVCSVKSPVAGPLRALHKAGGKVASFHPLFGPSTTTLRGADVVVCTGLDAEATQAVRDLFTSTPARLVDVGLDEHDRLMAQVLSLPHATAIAFAASLDARAPTAQATTFRKLRDVAAGVAAESPQVYYEIQVGNPFSDAALARLADAVADLRGIVARKDPAAFRALLDEGRRRLEAAP